LVSRQLQTRVLVPSPQAVPRLEQVTTVAATGAASCGAFCLFFLRLLLFCSCASPKHPRSGGVPRR
jgi:hypothetical protein